MLVASSEALLDLEDDAQLKGLTKECGPHGKPDDIRLERSQENATSGRHSLKLSLPQGGDWWGIHSLECRPDWSGYGSLVADVLNPTNSDVELHFAAADENTEFLAFGKRVFRGYTARSYTEDAQGWHRSAIS